MKICFLVLSADYHPWVNAFRVCGGSTWAKVAQQKYSFDVFEYRGRPLNPLIAFAVNRILNSRLKPVLWNGTLTSIEEMYLDKPNNVLRTEIPERWDNLFAKTLSALKFTHEFQDYDYFIRVNTTTYVNMPKLLEFLESCPQYAGSNSKKDFVPGWGIILSRDSVSKLLMPSNFPANIGLRNDDDAIGNWLTLKGIGRQVVPTMEFSQMNLTPMLRQQLKKSVFIRIKNQKDRVNLDPLYFQTLNRILED